jgi:N-acetyl-gamma-glutamyl-phosphate reductase
MIKAGIIGASGYSGIELVKILGRHDNVEIRFATSDTHAGKKLSEAYPCPYDIPLIARDAAPLDQVDVVFLALPYGVSTEYAKRALTAGARVIDFAADFRLHDASKYPKWYGFEHRAPELLAQSVYGIPELHREEIKQTKLVGNPGCYPTGVILGLAPIVRSGAASGTIIVDSKSGVSGAGRKASLSNSFVEVNENFAPYKIGRVHQHVAEMEQELQAISPKINLIFSPHLLPVNRGILSTMYVQLNNGWNDKSLRDLYAETYHVEPFIRILPNGQIASIAHSNYTNYCHISIHLIPDVGQAIICSSIDNLVKGASGQAVQNMNLMFGFEETTALV